MFKNPKYKTAFPTKQSYEQIRTFKHHDVKPFADVSKTSSIVIFLYKGQENSALVLLPGAKCYEMPCKVHANTNPNMLYVFTYA